MLLPRFLRHLIRFGELCVVDAKGAAHRFSGPPIPGIPPVTVRIHDPALHRRLVLRPGLAVGEAYMDGSLTVERGSIYDLLALCVENLARGGRRAATLVERLEIPLRRLQQFNPARRSRRNVAHHYDLSDSLYRLFLDADRQYSCAYFARPGQSLEEAQEAKKRHLAAKLLLKPGQSVLDIGSGWGGLALSLARMAGARVTGITLSEEQLKVARHRAREEGLEGQVDFALRDYRHQHGRFDRIVSVGMFEHVGVNHYRTFFRKLRDLLAEDGVAVLHSIGRAWGPGNTNAWVRKYIFPGGYIPALSEVVPAIERSGLFVTDVEILRLHYAETLREWRRRFLANRDRVAALYDERFFRMWEFYLAGSEVSFRHGGLMVFQVQLAKRQDAVPLTRDYIFEFERAAAEPALAKRRIG